MSYWICYDSYGFLLRSFGPSAWRGLGDLGVLEARQAGEDVLQVGVWVDASFSATFDQRVDDGSALASPSFAYEEPVL